MLVVAEKRSSFFLASRLVFAEAPRFEPESPSASLSPVSHQLASNRAREIQMASRARDPADEVALRDIERRMRMMDTGACDERPIGAGGGQEMRALGANESMGAGISTADVVLDTVKRGIAEGVKVAGEYLEERAAAGNKQLSRLQEDAHNVLDRTLSRDERRAASYRAIDGMMVNMPLVGATRMVGEIREFGKIDMATRMSTNGQVARSTVAHWLGKGAQQAESRVPVQAVRPAAERVMEKLSPPGQQLATWMATGMNRARQYKQEMDRGLSSVGRITEIENGLLDMAREFAGRLGTLRMHAQQPEMAYLQGDLVLLRQAVETYEKAFGASWDTLQNLSTAFKRS